MKVLYIFLFLFVSFFSDSLAQPHQAQTDVLIVGGGASGVTAAIQSARAGVKVTVLEQTPWLGGMLTSAGVSAIDGNHQLPSGLWGEFRSKLYAYYGGPEAVETGWVSNTLFEPSVGNKILKEMTALRNLQIWYQSQWESVDKRDGNWIVTYSQGKKRYTISAKVLVDCTELGDVLAAANAKYDVGMDSRHHTEEIFAPEEENDIIQDMTYVAVLKDYGKGANKTIRKPKNFDPEEFKHSCDVADPAAVNASPDLDCSKMITYGKLPNGKYMINWPKSGNDIYLNIIEKSGPEREKALEEAKQMTLRFVYYLQTVLGYKNLGLADDEFPTKDRLPFIPYHREARRVKGLVQLTLPHIVQPYEQERPLYRTGIAVGDYTIDHHHLKNPDAPKIDFVKIKVPSYTVPLGALIPKSVDGLIVAEKSISVSNIVSGATRLQPVVLELGQAAGALAALAVKENKQPAEVSVREVQQTLLNSKAYLLPFIDVKPDEPAFQAVQRIGATGILKGRGISYKWANQTWFYPNHPISEYDFIKGLQTYYAQVQKVEGSGKDMDIAFFLTQLELIDPRIDKAAVLKDLRKSETETITRKEVALVLDKYLNPFEKQVSISGQLISAN